MFLVDTKIVQNKTCKAKIQKIRAFACPNGWAICVTLTLRLGFPILKKIEKL